MNLTNSQFILLFLSAFLVVGCMTPLVRKFAIYMDVVDRPTESHKTHREPVPYMGGVAIVFGVVTVTYSAIIISGNSRVLNIANTVLIPAIVMGLVGLIDDLRKLSPWPRFLTQNLIGVLIAFILISTDTLGSPTGNNFLDFVITLFWIVGITNSINFFDNVDGGASGTVAISALFLSLISLQDGQYFIAGLSIVVSGATIGFLLWNRPPARIYMGDAGALFLGLLIATLTLRFDPNPIYLLASFAIPIFLLAVPIMDTSVAVISRLRRKISPFQGGQDHLSHRLMRGGLTKRQAVLSLWLLSIFFSSLAVVISYAPYTLERKIVVLGFLVWTLIFALFLRTRDSADSKILKQ